MNNPQAFPCTLRETDAELQSRVMSYRQAYPEAALSHALTQREETTHAGMTLRDYFAAKAMAASLAKHGIYDEGRDAFFNTYDCDELAVIAYTYADAMLKAREA